MKKFILLFCIITSFCTSALAQNYDANFKKSFYDSLINGMFTSLQDTIISNGYTKASAEEYVKTLKGRLNRTELENKTWGCVSQHSMEEMIHTTSIIDECFGDWANSFFTQNADTLSILQQQ